MSATADAGSLRSGLSHNALSGTIPDALGALTNLNYIGLAQNALTGLLPASLGQLKKLAILCAPARCRKMLQAPRR